MATKKAPFGGMTINFGGQKKSLEDVFGGKPITPSDMNKKLWDFVKKNALITKK